MSDASTVEVLGGYIKSLSLSLKGHGHSLADSLSEILLSRPDIVYLDISVSQRHLAEFNVLRQVCSLVLLSNKAEDAYHAFEYHAFDYLLMPIEFVRFIKGIDRFKAMRKHFSEQTVAPTLNDFFFVRTDSRGLKEILIRYADVILAQALQNYVLLRTEGNNTYTCHITMRDMEQHLPAGLFSRVHKSFIINDSKISSIEGYVINLTDKNYAIQIGNTYRKPFFDKINKRMVLTRR